MKVRTRFAPSPTGYLHVGGIRTALFAHLVAKAAGGQFILRFEDTDKKREVAGSAEHLITSLKAIGIEYDEGPDVGGEYGPYVQSERLEIYKSWAQKLIDSGRAYADPYTSQEVQGFREQAQANKQPFVYRNHRPDMPPVWDGTQPLRFKSEPKAYTWHDEVMGDITTGPEVVDDFILIKSDGYPTYNFAHIVDDAEMKITHVIRGQEFVSSMPNYLNLYEALDIKFPIFAHLPHIMNEQGNKKLGKRDGAKDVLDYIRHGYLPETVMSFIATLGWNDGTTKEIFTYDDLVSTFSLDRVQRSGARFDEKRLIWMNGSFIRNLSLDDLYARTKDFWPDSALTVDDDMRKKVLALVQDRMKTLVDLPLLTSFFFVEPKVDKTLISGNKQLRNLSEDEIKHILTAAHEALSATEWNPDAIQETLNNLLTSLDLKPAVLFGLVRIATTWAPFSPQLNDTLALLGKERSLARIQSAIAA
jgi:glutamyl-tRNA synthetase